MSKGKAIVEFQLLDDKDLKHLIVGILVEHYGMDFIMEHLNETEEIKEEILRVVKKYMKVTSDS